MHDLTSRLRRIVRQETGNARSLTYVPDLPIARDPEDVAERLGGQVIGRKSSTCVAIDRVWDDDHFHGRRRLSSYRPESGAPLDLFDRRSGAIDGWADRVVFFDVETTGLSGGAGTLAFLVGCGWFETEGFRVRQFFLNGPGGERAMLEALTSIFDEASLVVTYNGKSFDVPLMETRWAFHRTSTPTDDLPHFDMLPPARRLWGRRSLRSAERGAPRAWGRERWGVDATDVPRESCSLSTLERTVLGFHRHGDVPGLEIPTRYFHFLRTGDPAVVAGVLDHNRHDLISLAAVMSQALWLAQEGPDACREGREQLGLGRLYERAGDAERALRSYERATSADEPDVRCDALSRMALLHRRVGAFDAAAAAWQAVLDLLGHRRAVSCPLGRQAAEALAIHHEHRARNLSAAKRYAESLREDTSGRFRQDVSHRIDRIDRKLKRKADRAAISLNWDSAD